MSNIKPHDVHYIEAHRTRTALVEDPIEFEALAGVFASNMMELSKLSASDLTRKREHFPWKREHFPRKGEHLPRIRDYLPESGELRHSYRKRAYLWE